MIKKVSFLLFISIFLGCDLYAAEFFIGTQKQNIEIDAFTYDGNRLVIIPKTNTPGGTPTPSPTTTPGVGCQSQGNIECGYDIGVKPHPTKPGLMMYYAMHSRRGSGSNDDLIALPPGKTLVSKLPTLNAESGPTVSISYQNSYINGTQYYNPIELTISEQPGGTPICKSAPRTFLFTIKFAYSQNFSSAVGGCILKPNSTYYLNMRETESTGQKLNFLRTVK